MPIRPELRPFYPPHWHELSSDVRFDACRRGASVVDAHISLSPAVCRTDDGSMSKRRPGETAKAVSPGGLTSWRPRDSG